MGAIARVCGTRDFCDYIAALSETCIDAEVKRGLSERSVSEHSRTKSCLTQRREERREKNAASLAKNYGFRSAISAALREYMNNSGHEVPSTQAGRYHLCDDENRCSV